jgi:hypothetical protein
MSAAQTILARDVELRVWAGLERPPPSDDRVIYLHKDPAFLGRLDVVLSKVQPRRMIEIGIMDGGSTIYWAHTYRLDRLSAFDINPAPHLARYIDRHGLSEQMRVHCGVSQTDGAALLKKASNDMEGEFVDAIIDDASHFYHETRTTFEALFPLVRPGGCYIIEDWAWGHAHDWPPEVYADLPLMSRLICELMLICGHMSDVIEKVEIDRNFFVVWRGTAALPQDGTFRMTDHYNSRGFSVSL